jgi:2Fe-2S ferredoxin
MVMGMVMGMVSPGPAPGCPQQRSLNTARMPRINVVTREGRETAIEAAPGRSLMQVLRDHGYAEVLAVCGGCCSCATCHVYVEAPAAAQLAPCGEDESDMLEGSSQRRGNSRLSCQVMVTAELDGLLVTIAPEG